MKYLTDDFVCNNYGEDDISSPGILDTSSDFSFDDPISCGY